MSHQAKVLYQQDLNNISAYIIIKPQQQSYCTIKPKPVARASQRLWEILRPREEGIQARRYGVRFEEIESRVWSSFEIKPSSAAVKSRHNYVSM